MLHVLSIESPLLQSPRPTPPHPLSCSSLQKKKSASKLQSMSSPSSSPLLLFSSIESRFTMPLGWGWNRQKAVRYVSNFTRGRVFKVSLCPINPAASHLLSIMTTASIPASGGVSFSLFLFSSFEDVLALSFWSSDAAPSPRTCRTNSSTESAFISGSSSTHRVGSKTGNSSGRHSVTCFGANKAHCTPVAFESRSFESVMKYALHGRETCGASGTKHVRHR